MSANYELLVERHDTAGTRLAGSLSWSRGLSELRALSPPRAGRLDVALDNRDGAYNPATTPLRSGQAVTLRASYTDPELGTVEVPLFAGDLQRPEQRSATYRERVELQAFGVLARLADTRDLTTEHYQAIRTDEALHVLCDAAGIPEEQRVFDVGLSTMAHWWLDGADALVALRELVATEGPSAQLYEDAERRLVFRNRHALYTEARSVLPQASYGTDGLPVLRDSVRSERRLRDVVNRCTILVRRREVQPSGVVWSLGTPLTLAPGESRTFEARLPSGDPMTAAETPTVLAGDLVLSAGAVDGVVLGRTSGARIPVTVIAGPSGSVVDLLRLRARAVTVTSETVVTQRIDTTASVAEYGVRPFSLPMRAEIDLGFAQDCCDAWVALHQGGRATLTFDTVNANQEALAALLSREVGDRMHVALPRLGLDDDVLVLQRTDALGHGGVHRATFGCDVGGLAFSEPFRADQSEADGPHRAWF